MFQNMSFSKWHSRSRGLYGKQENTEYWHIVSWLWHIFPPHMAYATLLMVAEAKYARFPDKSSNTKSTYLVFSMLGVTFRCFLMGT